MKTGQGLKEYAIAQLGKPYWWGTFGQRADGALYAQKKAQYPDHYTATADSSTTLTTAPAVSHSPLATVSLRQYAYGTTIIKPAPFFLHPAFFMFSFLFLLLFLWDFFKHTYFLPLHTTLFYQEHSLSEWLICQSCHGKKRISIRPL